MRAVRNTIPRVPRRGSSTRVELPNVTVMKVQPLAVPTYHVRNLKDMPRHVKAHNVVFHGIQCCNNIVEWNAATGTREWPILQSRNIVYDNCHERFIRSTLFAEVFPMARSIYMYQSSVDSYIPFLNRLSFLKFSDRPKIFTTSTFQYEMCPYPGLVLLTPEEMESIVEMYMRGQLADEEANAFNRIIMST